MPAVSSSGPHGCWFRSGFLLLIIQALSELIKRFAFLKGLIPDPSEKHVAKTAEEELAEEILRSRGDRAIAEEIEQIGVGKEEKR